MLPIQVTYLMTRNISIIGVCAPYSRDFYCEKYQNTSNRSEKSLIHGNKARLWY
jgi:hypothetical protein